MEDISTIESKVAFVDSTSSRSEKDCKFFQNYKPLPDLNFESISHLSLRMDGESNIEVTSMDISANGCFVLVGCSNGMYACFVPTFD